MGQQRNERLAELMLEANLSAKALARAVRDAAGKRGEEVSCDHTAIARWRAGVQPRPRTTQILCDVLGQRLGRVVRPADIGLPDPTPVSPELGITYPDEPQQAIEALATLWKADIEGVSSVIDAPTSNAAWSEASLSWLVRPRRDETGVREPGRRAGIADIEAIRATTATFDHLDNRFGGRHARHALLQFLRTDLLPTLSSGRVDDTGCELFRAAAEATLLAAWMSYDAGSHGLAQRYFIQSLRLAQAADDALLAASILDAMSHQATFLGHFRAAATLARAAQTGAGSTASPGLDAHFLLMEARAHAGAGDRTAAEQSIAQAARRFDRRRVEVEPEWMLYFDESEFAAELAHCYRDLGDPSRAVSYAKQALDGAGSSQRSDFFVTMVLAAGQLGDGEGEQAVATLTDAVGLGASVKSARAVEYLRQFRLQLPRGLNVEQDAGLETNELWQAAGQPRI